MKLVFVYSTSLVVLLLIAVINALVIDQLAKPTFRSRHAHTSFVSAVTEQSEEPIDTVASTLVSEYDFLG